MWASIANEAFFFWRYLLRVRGDFDGVLETGKFGVVEERIREVVRISIEFEFELVSFELAHNISSICFLNWIMNF